MNEYGGLERNEYQGDETVTTFATDHESLSGDNLKFAAQCMHLHTRTY